MVEDQVWVATAIPEDVAAHLEAAIQLSNRRVQTRLLHEADILLAQNLPLAAVVIASAVLESALEAVPPERYVGHMAEIERWRTMRNTAAHCAVPQVTSEGEGRIDIDADGNAVAHVYLFGTARGETVTPF